ncbi:MAG TPA: hypothetical protein VIU87_02235, partial [Mycobacterium sp.]
MAETESVVSQPNVQAFVGTTTPDYLKAVRLSRPVIGTRDDNDAGVEATQRLAGVAERSEWQRRYASKVRLTDIVVVVIAVVLAQGVRFGFGSGVWGDFTARPPWGSSRFFIPAFSALFVFAWLCALAAFHTRSPRLVGTGVEEYRRVVTASFWVFGAIAI